MGDTMLGRGVAERLAADPCRELLAAELAAVARDADLFIASSSTRVDPVPAIALVERQRDFPAAQPAYDAVHAEKAEPAGRPRQDSNLRPAD